MVPVAFLLAILPITVNGAATQMLNPAWQRAADNLHAAMDTSADPCDDFYQYTCGNWAKVNVRPPYVPDYDSMTKLTFDVYSNVTDLFSQVDTKAQPRAVQQAKIYFDACIGALTKSTSDDITYILKLLDGYGKWPMLNQDWTGPIGGKDLNSASALFGRLAGTIGVNTFLRGVPMADWKKPKRMLLAILPARPIVSSTSAISDLVPLIKDVVRSYAKVAGVTLSESKLSADTKELANIELSWAKALVGTPIASFPLPYNIYNLTEAQQRWGYFDWTKLLTAVAKDNMDADAMLKVPLLVPFESQFDKLDAIIKSMSSRAIQNFLLWRLVYTEMHYLPTFEKHREAFYKLKHGTVEAVPRWITCADSIITQLPWAAGRVYVDQWKHEVDPTKSIEVLDGMIDNVLGSFKDMLANLTWMDKDSTAAADLKVDNLVRNVAYNDFVIDDDKLNALYSELDLSENDDTFIRINKVLRFDVWTKIRTLGKPVDRTNMMKSPAEVNAWYYAQLNNINFPAAILNEPFFGADGPMAVNFGAIGAVMGHELTHGFDNNGVKWDAFGAYHKDGWMTKHSMEGFQVMADCVTAQYDGFCFPQLKEDNCVIGAITLGENIADNGGLMAAYLAYKSNVTESHLPAPMDKYTMDQIFFLSFGHNWCGKPTDKGLRQEIINGGHSPDEARVMVTLRNIPEFADAFKCKKGNTMAPEKRCSVWIDGEEDYPVTATTPKTATKIQSVYWMIGLIMFVRALHF